MKNDSRNTPTKQRLSATSGVWHIPDQSETVWHIRELGTSLRWVGHGNTLQSSQPSSYGDFEYLLCMKERGEEVESFMIDEYLFKKALYIYCDFKGWWWVGAFSWPQWGIWDDSVRVFSMLGYGQSTTSNWKSTDIPSQYNKPDFGYVFSECLGNYLQVTSLTFPGPQLLRQYVL